MSLRHLLTAHVPAQSADVGAYTLTFDRFWATAAALLALVAAVAGGLNLAVADGGPGTGNGVVAGAAALVLGLIAAVLGGLVVIRSRRVS